MQQIHSQESVLPEGTAMVKPEVVQGQDAGQGMALKAVLGIRDFRLLWLGEGISVLGDHFHMIALPWLVLQLTGDSLAMGTVLALTAVPRALFMLVGGALTDRFSPRTIMLGSNLARFILVGALAGLVLAGAIQLWMLYLFALTFGLADAFFYPAQSSIVPRLVRPEQLQAANSLVQGTMQLSMLAGPVLAGVMIAWLDGRQPESAAPGLEGIGLAFVVDALTFLASLAALWLMRPVAEVNTAGAESVLSSIRSGLSMVWRDVTLRTFFFIVATFTFLINGPFNVAVPVLANTRYEEGAAAFGIILSAFGGGSLVGMVLAGALPRLPSNRIGPVLLVITSLLGIGLALHGVVPVVEMAGGIALAMGIANGYVNVLFITWLQARTPAHMLGRMMSLLMFSMTGLYPISIALSGAAGRVSASGLLVASGLTLMVVVLAVAVFSSAVRDMGGEAAAAV